MAGLPNIIGLLYRADWTRLSLSAEVRFEADGDHRSRAALLAAPGRRHRLDYESDGGSRVDGCDGEQDWTLQPPGLALPPSIVPATDLGPLADIAAVIPGLPGTAARTAAEAVRRTAVAVSAARSFLGDMRGGPRS